MLSDRICVVCLPYVSYRRSTVSCLALSDWEKWSVQTHEERKKHKTMHTKEIYFIIDPFCCCFVCKIFLSVAFADRQRGKTHSRETPTTNQIQASEQLATRCVEEIGCMGWGDGGVGVVESVPVLPLPLHQLARAELIESITSHSQTIKHVDCIK